ncbi:unnamed protein product, partial [Rhizoctonia solani]
MSETRFPVDYSQVQPFLNKVADFLQTYPLESYVALAAAALGSYTLRHLITPAYYPNIDVPSSKSVTFGHLFDIFSPEGIPFHDQLQDRYGSVSRVRGMFGKENLFVSDPRFLHEVLVRGVNVTFRHTQFFYDFFKISLGMGLFATKGTVVVVMSVSFTKQPLEDIHRAQRKDIGSAQGREIDILKWCSAIALELIGQARLGHTFGVLKGVELTYSLAAKNFLPALMKLLPLQAFFPFLYNLQPTALQSKLAEWAPLPSIWKINEIIDVQDEQAVVDLTCHVKGAYKAQTMLRT